MGERLVSWETVVEPKKTVLVFSDFLGSIVIVYFDRYVLLFHLDLQYITNTFASPQHEDGS
jgi:hypothetical protein